MNGAVFPKLVGIVVVDMTCARAALNRPDMYEAASCQT